MTNYTDYSEAVNARMEKLKTNANIVAPKIGITPQHLYKLLAGDRTWNDRIKKKLNNYLGIEVVYRHKKVMKKTGKCKGVF